MRKLFFAALVLLVAACQDSNQTNPGSTGSSSVVIDVTEPNTPATMIWATHYYLLNVETASDGVPIRDMNDSEIGPLISRSDWCSAAIEGSFRVDDTTYTYAGTKSPRQADCSHNPSERVRWKKTRNRYGTGSSNNPLIPYKTLACDLGTVDGSTPWLNGGYAKFGQRVFIPDAVGTQLPNGTVHDGYFECGDVGGAIVGNHIDVFIGDASNSSDARARDPFDFIGHRPGRTVQAFFLSSPVGR